MVKSAKISHHKYVYVYMYKYIWYFSKIKINLFLALSHVGWPYQSNLGICITCVRTLANSLHCYMSVWHFDKEDSSSHCTKLSSGAVGDKLVASCRWRWGHPGLVRDVSPSHWQMRMCGAEGQPLNAWWNNNQERNTGHRGSAQV